LLDLLAHGLVEVRAKRLLLPQTERLLLILLLLLLPQVHCLTCLRMAWWSCVTLPLKLPPTSPSLLLLCIVSAAAGPLLDLLAHGLVKVRAKRLLLPQTQRLLLILLLLLLPQVRCLTCLRVA
jgi:hypothetical protein